MEKRTWQKLITALLFPEKVFSKVVKQKPNCRAKKLYFPYYLATTKREREIKEERKDGEVKREKKSQNVLCCHCL